ncbi:hypothetical protein B0T14DRAFT_598083 [Immersiella caudata]|uniref:SET domain-containing protein n=1 Tax=Immersiella caudata TaxID=314043 RepID=A0AA39XEU1_9PEZI|nr:hypothetical protein B0T14DRAFT_598083 [Immersiella caudata]
MRQTALLYGLCAQLLALAVSADKQGECLKGPLVLEGHETCAASSSEKKPIFKDEKWEWKGEKSDAWDGPYDCVENYCVFVNRELGGGLVLISDERNVHVIDNFPKKKLFKYESPPWYVKEMPGKGIGLIANRTIKKGDVIMQTTPSMLSQFGPHLDFDGETRIQLYERAAKRLPKEEYEAFMGQYGVDEFIKVDRNSFRLFINGENSFSGHLAIYPHVSRMNHDCRPNIVYRIDNITHNSIAVQDIQPGEELTISYIDGHLSRKERQKRLSDWDFKCTCAHCSMSDEEAAVSDARMERIYAIEEDLEKMVAGKKKIDTEAADELLRLYKEERFITYIGQAYTRAALLHSLMGHEKETKELAKEAAEAMRIEYGEHNSDSKAMKLLAEDTKAHWSWDAMRKHEERNKQREQMEQEQKQKVLKVEDITAEDIKKAKL